MLYPNHYYIAEQSAVLSPRRMAQASDLYALDQVDPDLPAVCYLLALCGNLPPTPTFLSEFSVFGQFVPCSLRFPPTAFASV